MSSLLEIIKKSTDFLAAKGVENARFNAEWLIGHALGLKRMQLYVQFERELLELELEKIRPLLRRRAAHEPLQYILGETLFAGLTLKCDRRALIPRPETEYLIELILKRVEDQPPRSILDLGTGTGAIALALAKALPEAVITAGDFSPDALALARENASATGLSERIHFLETNWFSALPAGSRFDLIVSNPPYLTPAEVQEASAEVREFEPHSALVGGEQGLDDLSQLIAQSQAYLNPGGWLALETGIAQHGGLQKQAERAGWSRFESVRDLTDRDRYVFARAP
ncbi:MAG TPA: peptide chain release factor N(5)-glutamine methyltransferase [Opitutaceae bacterium]|nr:peptide chain release factor N(5)-glutamine methyltransferase [Opitutaceae bacterium]